MKIRSLIFLCCVGFCFSLASAVSLAAEEVGDEYGDSPYVHRSGCNDSLVHFVEGKMSRPLPLGALNRNGSPSALADENSDLDADLREVTTVFKCHGGKPYIPSMSTMHFMELNGDRICYYDRACGNMDSWQVQLTVDGYMFAFESFSEFFSSVEYGQQVLEVENHMLSIQASIARQEVTRHCLPPSEKICLDRH